MIFASDVNTPIAQPITSPLRTILEVTSGLIYKVEIEFPPGALGLHYVCVYHGGYQMYPSSPGTWFHSDGFVISFDDTYLNLYPPFQYDIFSYNTDTVNPHFVQVRLGIVSKEVYMARFLPTYTWKYFKAMLEDIQIEQERRRLEQAKAGINLFKEQ